jgi:hypothetical protein
MAYTPNSQRVAEEMLHSIGLESMDELFADIPREVKLDQLLNLAPGLGEIELRQYMQTLAGRNLNVDQYPCFLGAGAYDHFVPAVCGPDPAAFGVLYFLHALSAGNKPGNFTGHIRISNPDLSVNRHGSLQCLHV